MGHSWWLWSRAAVSYLNYIKGLTVMLQESSIDITRAMILVEDTRKSIQDVRHRVGEFHGGWMKRCRFVWGAKLPWWRDCYGGAEESQQCHKYFLQYSVFASERRQIRTWGRQTRFLPRAPSNLVTPQGLMPCSISDEEDSWMAPPPWQLGWAVQTGSAHAIASTFGAPYVVNQFTSCDQSKLPSSPLQVPSQCDEEVFPNIFRLLKIVATLPVTTCQPERSFSALRRLKKFLRTTTREDRFNGVASIHIQRKVNIVLNFVMEEFARRQNRRWVLQWIYQVEVFLAPLGQW